jgi:hypothetical protein
VTKSIMKLIKLNLIKSSWPKAEKRLFWAVATLAWSESFRIPDLCSSSGLEFDIQTTLLCKNVSFGQLLSKRGDFAITGSSCEVT